MAMVEISLRRENKSRSSARSELLQQAIVPVPYTYVHVVSVVSMFTRLLVGRCGVRISSELRDLSLLPSVQTASGVHPVFYPVCTGILSQAKAAGA